MAEIPVEETCIMCLRRGTQKCVKCHDAQYCSKDCQALDWKNHKLICTSFATPKPAEHYRRGLLFPEGKGPPRWEWVESEIRSFTYEGFDGTKYFGSDEKGRSDIGRNLIQARETDRGKGDILIVYHSSDCQSRPVNNAVRNFTRARLCSSYLRGPQLVMRCVGNRLQDVDMRDARNAADYFSCASRLYSDSQLKQERLLAAVIACQQQVKVGQRKYGDRVIDGNDGIFACDGSSIANLLGIPLLIRRDARPPASTYDDLSVLCNDETVLLKRDVETATIGIPDSSASADMTSQFERLFGGQSPFARPRSENQGENGFGTTSTAWNGKAGPVGPVIAVRADGKALLCQHLEAICAYVRDEVEPRLQRAKHSVQSGQLVDQREAVLNTITREDFAMFYDGYKRARSLNDNNWANAVSPYEIKKNHYPSRWMELMVDAQRAAGIAQWSDRGTDFGSAVVLTSPPQSNSVKT